MSITKRIAAVVGFVALILPLSQVSAQAAATNELAAAGIDATQLRPGWQLVGDEIVWDGGAVMASIIPMGADDCQSGYVCAWDDAHYTGRRLQFASAGLRAEMADYSFHDKMSSWRNRNSRDARWYHNENGGGASRCMNNGARVSDLGPGSIFDDGDKMDSLRVYTNSTSC